MDKKLKEKWVEALRGGEYKQGEEELYDSFADTYCCLGVLGVQMGCLTANLDGKHYLNGAQIKLGPRVQAGLASMNDAGVPFEMIAGFIHENL